MSSVAASEEEEVLTRRTLNKQIRRLSQAERTTLPPSPSTTARMRPTDLKVVSRIQNSKPMTNNEETITAKGTSLSRRKEPEKSEEPSSSTTVMKTEIAHKEPATTIMAQQQHNPAAPQIRRCSLSTADNNSTRESSPATGGGNETATDNDNDSSNGSGGVGGGGGGLKLPPAFYDCSTSGGTSPNTSKSVSPIPPRSATITCPISGERRDGSRKSTPVPSDSPLLSAANSSSVGSNLNLQRVRSFNRTMRRAKSIRRAMRNSTSSVDSLTDFSSSSTSLPSPTEVTFRVKKSNYGRRGWKVMPAEDSVCMKSLGAEVIDRVMTRIRELEFSGRGVPGEITVNL